MSKTGKLKVVLCWHMHQPVYYDSVSKQYQLPWTYLHGIKDYVDMVAHLEAVPEARAVVNFVPILLEQLDDYHQQINDFLKKGTTIRDSLLAALVSKSLPCTTSSRFELLNQCLRANHQRLIQRFLPYSQLAEKVEWLKERPDIVPYLDEQFLVDMLMWYHLAWLGETVRRQDSRVKHLIRKGQHFSYEDRLELLEIIGELLGGVLNRYKVLAEKGQIELSVTPYAHPIIPLLLDISTAREAVPDLPLPQLTEYPGGKDRVRWHMKKGIEVFKEHFGFEPQGCWPSEGSLSEETIRTVEEFGIRWMASGENVLRNSLEKSSFIDASTHRPYQLPQSKISCFFRDDNLSDLIGFSFAEWHADDAVDHFIHHLENISTFLGEEQQDYVIPIVLDGENAWEHYPENGYYFLSTLYQRLAAHPQLELTTFSHCLDLPTVELPTLITGSWVYGTLTTWIGDKDKNRGWEMLIEAKQVYDRKIDTLSPEKRAEAEQQLAMCEGSDWFWWFGDYNPGDVVRDFDQLFRLHLTNLYRILDESPPYCLQQAFTFGGDNAPAVGGVMRPGQEQSA